MDQFGFVVGGRQEQDSPSVKVLLQLLSKPVVYSIRFASRLYPIWWVCHHQSSGGWWLNIANICMGEGNIDLCCFGMVFGFGNRIGISIRAEQFWSDVNGCMAQMVDAGQPLVPLERIFEVGWMQVCLSGGFD